MRQMWPARSPREHGFRLWWGSADPPNVSEATGRGLRHLGRHVVGTGAGSSDVSTSRLELLYLANATLLITHEIDSGYWREWELLHLPGGIQFFLIVHLGLLFVVLYGFGALLRRRRSGLWFSFGLAVAGVAAFVIHATLLLRGHPEFRLPASLAVLGVTLVVSLIQGTAAGRLLARRVTTQG